MLWICPRISLIKVVQILLVLTHKYADGKCTGENGGTVTAGGDKSTQELLEYVGLKDVMAILTSKASQSKLFFRL